MSLNRSSDHRPPKSVKEEDGDLTGSSRGIEREKSITNGAGIIEEEQETRQYVMNEEVKTRRGRRALAEEGIGGGIDERPRNRSSARTRILVGEESDEAAGKQERNARRSIEERPAEAECRGLRGLPSGVNSSSARALRDLGCAPSPPRRPTFASERERERELREKLQQSSNIFHPWQQFIYIPP